MDKSSIISLISQTFEQDEIGQFIPVESSRQVYCDALSITRAEWYEAGREGLQPAYVFTMFRYDYEGETIIEFEGRRYGVYRTYIGKNDVIELYAEEKGGLDEPEG